MLGLEMTTPKSVSRAVLSFDEPWHSNHFLIEKLSTALEQERVSKMLE